MTVYFAAIGALCLSQGATKPPVIQLEAKDYTRTAPLEIKADGTVVDGKGATFHANGTGVGIQVGSFKNVTIKNIKLVGFAVGLSAEGASGLNVAGVSVVGGEGAVKPKSSVGFKLEKVSDSALTAVQVSGCINGASLTGCTKVTIGKSDLSHNDEAGIRMSASGNCIVRDNKLSFEGLVGLSIDNGSDHNQILRNLVVRCKSNGITIGAGEGQPSTDDLLQGNDVSWTEGGNGITVKAQAKNNVNENVAAHCQVGIMLSTATGTGLKGNVLVGNTQFGILDDGGSMNSYDSNTFAQDNGSTVGFCVRNEAGHANVRFFQNIFVDYQKPLLIEDASPITMQSNMFVGARSVEIADLAEVKGQAPLALDNQTDSAKEGLFMASVGSLAQMPSIYDHLGGISVAAMAQKGAEVVVEGSLTGAFQGEEEVLARYKGDFPIDLTFPPRTMVQVRIKGVPQIPAAFLALLGDHSIAKGKETTDDSDAVSSPIEAVDGDWKSSKHGWQPKKGLAGEWWQVDMKLSSTITAFAVMSDPANPSGFFPKFHIQVSDTGRFQGEETTVITETNWSSRAGALHVYKCAPVQARYVRLVGDQDQGGVRLAQFGVYGAGQ